MGHSHQVYCAHQFSELGEIGGVWGLDKNLAIALKMVHSGGVAPNNELVRFDRTCGHPSELGVRHGSSYGPRKGRAVFQFLGGAALFSAAIQAPTLTGFSR